MTTSPAPSAPQPPQTASGVQILSQYVRDLSFENPHAFMLAEMQGKPGSLNLSINVQSRQVGDVHHEVLLQFRIETRNGDKVAFLIELTYGALVAIPAGLQAAQIRPMLLIDAPQFLFPFARAVIAEATTNGGFQPLLLPPVDFVELYRKQGQASADAAPADAVVTV
jgi:preprotein translocase subunit SecB